MVTVRAIASGEELQQLRSSFLPTQRLKKPRVKRRPKSETRLGRNKVTAFMVQRIWELYHNLQMSYHQIAKQLNCAATTVHAALRRFENDGKQFRDRRMFNGRNNRRLKIVAPIAKYLLSRDVLERWSGYCLQ